MTVLKVSKVSNPHSVAGAIAGLIRDTGLAVMQAIGATATNQAIKAIAIARSFMLEEDLDLLVRVSFLDVEFGGQTRTAMRFEIAHRVDFPADAAPIDEDASIGTIGPRPERATTPAQADGSVTTGQSPGPSPEDLI